MSSVTSPSYIVLLVLLLSISTTILLVLLSISINYLLVLLFVSSLNVYWSQCVCVSNILNLSNSGNVSCRFKKIKNKIKKINNISNSAVHSSNGLISFASINFI